MTRMRVWNVRGGRLVVAALLSVLSVAAMAEGAPAAPSEDAEVVGGQAADPGEDPWMAALVLDEGIEPNPYLGLVCGGSLIAPDTVVTAAHCVEGASPGQVDVIVGTRDLLPTTGRRIGVRTIRIHPRNDPFVALNDAAVLQLVHPAGPGTAPIDLVAPGEEPLWAPASVARFTGWGADEMGIPISRLQEAEAPIISDADCRDRFRPLFRGVSMVCAGDISPTSTGDVSPCFGDSGGPLTVLDGSRPVLVGLVLGGYRCGDPNYPAIFTEVAAVRGFLLPYLDPDSAPWKVQHLRARRAGTQGREAIVQWEPPVFDGGTRLLRYVITVQPGNRTLFAGPGATRTRISGLPPNALVRISIAAQNGVGTGPTRTVEVRP